jgi:hypothetical protein
MGGDNTVQRFCFASDLRNDPALIEAYERWQQCAE